MVKEREEASSGCRLMTSAVAAALFIALAGCSSGPTLGIGETPDTGYRLTVTITNVGNGFGRALVTFPEGTKRSPCTAVLGPGESCSPWVERAFPTESADIRVSAEPGSRFIGWTGAYCSGTNNECTVTNNVRDPDVEIGLEARFDLVDGGS